MQKRKRNFIVANAAIIFGVVFFVVISSALSDVEALKCVFLNKLHLYCPGCGGTRAVYALLNLDFVASFVYNPVVILGGIAYMYYDVRAIIAIYKKDEAYFLKRKFILLMVLAGILIAYFVIRNVLLINGIDLIGDVLGKGVI